MQSSKEKLFFFVFFFFSNAEFHFKFIDQKNCEVLEGITSTAEAVFMTHSFFIDSVASCHLLIPSFFFAVCTDVS